MTQHPKSEFSLIDDYFKRQFIQRGDVLIGIGDDCAVLKVPNGKKLAVSMDLLVSGTHFLLDIDPKRLGHKALAVNLSDLAAQGATPAWVTLGLALPESDSVWLEQFCSGFFELAHRYNVQLVGGDTTRGPLTIAVQAHGFVDNENGLSRAKACHGDLIYVTGTLGDAAAALKTSRNEYLRSRLDCPEPRVQQGLDLAGLATAAIDISDGFAQDLGHILQSSDVGATVYIEKLPLSEPLIQILDQTSSIEMALTGGDDYELCFTLPPQHRQQLQQISRQWNCRCTEVGIIEKQSGLRCIWNNGQNYTLKQKGYDHFG